MIAAQVLALALGACGDGVRDANEECDDHNTAVQDGCNEFCRVEQNYYCYGAPSTCKPLGPFVRTRADNKDANSHCLWWTEDTIITWHFSEMGNPETPGDTEHDAIVKSFQTWESLLEVCASVRFQEGSRSPARKAEYLPASTSNENVLMFRQRVCSDVVGASDNCWKDDTCNNQYDCWSYDKRALAITSTFYDLNSGHVFDSDVEFNQPSFIFTTVDAPACVPPIFNTNCVASDVQNTTTHEIGHMLGLAHSNAAGSTMNPQANAGETSKRVVDEGSHSAVCSIYPAGRPSRDCVFKPVSSELGAPPKGCSVSAAGLWLWAGVLALRRRR